MEHHHSQNVDTSAAPPGGIVSTIILGFGRPWRGVAVERTLFGPVFRFGWLSVGVSKYDLPDWAQEWHAKLEAALARGGRTAGKGQMR